MKVVFRLVPASNDIRVRPRQSGNVVLPMQFVLGEPQGRPEKEEKPKGGLFGKLKAAAAAAEQKGEENQKGAPKDAQQATLFSTLTEVQEIKSGVPADAFSIPAGYKEIQANMNRMR